jgi:hypothetical protein
MPPELAVYSEGDWAQPGDDPGESGRPIRGLTESHVGGTPLFS